MKKLLLSSAFALALVACANAAVIANWTFETSVPTTGGPLSPEVGAGIATSNTGGTFSNPAGAGGSAESWSSNGWDVGEYFQFQVSTTGLTGVTVSWDAMGSNTGPRDFDLQYSTTGLAGSFTTFSSPDVLVAYSNFTADLSGITSLNNDSSIFIRLTDTSTVSVNGGNRCGNWN